MWRIRSGGEFERLASYSRAARQGDYVAVSGTAALDEHGVSLFPDDPASQTKEAFERALQAAAALGATKEDVVRTRIYLQAGTEWKGVVKIHGELFAGVDPANTTLHVAELIPPGALVEVELEAVASGAPDVDATRTSA